MCITHSFTLLVHDLSLSLSLSLFWSSHSIWYFVLLHLSCSVGMGTCDVWAGFLQVKTYRLLRYKGSQDNFDIKISLIVSNDYVVWKILHNFFCCMDMIGSVIFLVKVQRPEYVALGVRCRHVIVHYWLRCILCIYNTKVYSMLK